MSAGERIGARNITLTQGAHEVGSDLSSVVELDIGVERPALFKEKGEAVLFGMAMGLAVGRKKEGGMTGFGQIEGLESGGLDLSSRIHLLGDEEEKLNPVRALSGYASWGLEHLREYYYAGTKYEISKVAQILSGPAILCSGCGAMISGDDSLEECPKCGILVG